MTTTVSPSVPRIRRMNRRDVLPVLLIERESFDDPWKERDFLSAMKRSNGICLLTENYGAITGFAICEVIKAVILVRNFAVSADCRRRGIGTHMVKKLVALASERYCSQIVLDVRESNLEAQLFFRECEFRAVSVLRDWFDNGEDAYRMVRMVGVDSGLDCKREGVR